MLVIYQAANNKGIDLTAQFFAFLTGIAKAKALGATYRLGPELEIWYAI